MQTSVAYFKENEMYVADGVEAIPRMYLSERFNSISSSRLRFRQSVMFFLCLAHFENKIQNVSPGPQSYSNFRR